MFTPADLKLEFEKNARLFWREWDDFDYLIKKAPKNATYLDAAHILLHSHGKEGIERMNELEELFKLDTNKKISVKLLELMCKSNTAPKDMEEEELLHRRKEVEMALHEFQSCFLQQKVFYSYMHFSDTQGWFLPCISKLSKAESIKRFVISGGRYHSPKMRVTK